MSDAAHATDAFARDLLAAVRVWRHAWWMPVISVLLGATVWTNGAERLMTDAAEGSSDGAGGFAVVLLVVSLTELGWFGTEREVHRRVWSGQDPSHALGRTTLAYVGPFVRLGLLVGWPLIVLPFAFGEGETAAATAAGWVVTVIVYVALTFVTPELAYRTRTATGAFVRGTATLTQQFSRVRWHVLLPPLLIVTVGGAAGAPSIPEGLRIVVGALGTLAGLACKGAIARRWLVLHTDAFAQSEATEIEASVGTP